MKEKLNPSLEDLGLECVLMQAWKKTSSYLRYHSWYADTLDIDYQSLRIPDFIREIQDELKTPEKWRPRPLRMVPAPKSQKWEFDGKGNWRPQERVNPRLRPLAHVALRDQVVATAIMMCLADRVETFLGDPRLHIVEEDNRLIGKEAKAKENRKKILAYGHRLFCDSRESSKKGLSHRWGSNKLYRQYFQDYRTFLERPDAVADLAMKKLDDSEIAIVHADLSEFYDRVRPSLLHKKLRKFQYGANEEPFFALTKRVFNWRWSGLETSADYGKEPRIAGFEESIALPQGLVASGFFANVVLSDLDLALRKSIGKFDIKEQFFLEDACYYVDDLRFVVRVKKKTNQDNIKKELTSWLRLLLNSKARGLRVNREKTKVTMRRSKKLFLVPQSRAAQRIQNEISGTFDMLHGTELIGAIEGFFHIQKRYSTSRDTGKSSQADLFVGMSDMTDETASRFAAARFRRTFRSLRPLLATSQETEEYRHADDDGEVALDDQEASVSVLPDKLVLSKEQLDERARLFAMSLIEEWIANPANVRLLRIAFDMYPDEKFLQKVLGILRPGWQSRWFDRRRRKICLYCLAELFRAGATETAMVSDEDCLPEHVSAEEYHEILTEEANSILKDYLREPRPKRNHPWYLMQQVMLYLTARNPFPKNLKTANQIDSSLELYFRFSDFLRGYLPESFEERAIFLIMAHTGFGIGIGDFKRLLNNGKEKGKFLTEVDKISPLVAHQLWRIWRKNATNRLIRRTKRLGLEPEKRNEKKHVTVAGLANETGNPFWEERNLLALASWLMSLDGGDFENTITPWQILCKCQSVEGEHFGKVDPRSFKLDEHAYPTATRLFKVPDWCEHQEERRKFQVGLLLRFAIRGSTALDSSFAAPFQLKKPFTYNRPLSHWEQQRYSAYQGRSAFGHPWLPLSSFVEDMLFQLLRWPGAGISTKAKSLDQIKEEVDQRIHSPNHASTFPSPLFLEHNAPFPYKLPKENHRRSLRIGIVQSIIPDDKDYENRCEENDPELKDDRLFRVRHRAHIATLLEGVSQMLRVRESHRGCSGADDIGLDLLIFPELAVHPEDMRSLILPFIRKHKCIVLCGMVYHRKHKFDPNSELLNSCFWVIPEWTKANGFQVRFIEQGKKHLSRDESAKLTRLVGFRPAQWLIEYEWKNKGKSRPLVLSASVCFDATDLDLAADLKYLSDLYVVCALNKDVGTFDSMSKNLSYHMFQGVIVVNNGRYGGSSFFMPYKEQFRRQVLHFHGQPQATISFAEIDPEKLLKRPRSREDLVPEGKWKTPPAGWEKR